MPQARYYVHDRGTTVARELWRWTYLNPRFAVVDRTTGATVDDGTTRYAARLAADTLNHEAERSGHSHNVGGVLTPCDSLAHCPSVCSCPRGACEATR